MWFDWKGKNSSAKGYMSGRSSQAKGANGEKELADDIIPEVTK